MDLLNSFITREEIISYLFKFTFITLIFLLFSTIIQLITKSIRKIVGRGKSKPTYSAILIDTFRYFFWFIFVAIILSILGYKEIALTLSGVIALFGVILSQTLASTLRDLIAGVFLILDEDFKIGCKIRTGNIEGVVVNLNLRKTKIRDNNGSLHIIPNRRIDSGYILIKK